MEERKINFETNDDKTPVLDPDGKLYNKLISSLKEMNENFSLMLYLLNNGSLTEGTKQNSMSLFERKAVEILNQLGYDGYFNKNENEYTKEIRSLNQENRELRKQLGMKVSNEDVRERFKLIRSAIERWWRNEGTDNVEDIILQKGGIDVSLRGNLFMGVCDKNQLNVLKEKGFDLTYSEWIGEHTLSATENNFSLIKDKIKKSFPHSNIISIDTRYRKLDKDGKERALLIETIKIYISDLNDIKITEP